MIDGIFEKIFVSVKNERKQKTKEQCTVPVGTHGYVHH